MLLDATGRFTASTRLLLRAVAGVDTALLEAAIVRPHTDNWLRFPWYPAARGGACVIGRSIYLQGRQWRGTHMRTGHELLHTLLILAHEVGHLPQAAGFGTDALGRTRFVVWAAWQYFISALRHGRHAHDRAPLEIEAEEGRRVLARLLQVPGASGRIQSLLAADEVDDMLGWLATQRATIDMARADYRAKHGLPTPR